MESRGGGGVDFFNAESRKRRDAEVMSFQDFLDGRYFCVDGIDFGLCGAAKREVVEAIVAWRPEGVGLDENAVGAELVDSRQFEADFEMSPLVDLRVAAKERLAIDLQVVAFTRVAIEVFGAEDVAVADTVVEMLVEP